MLSVTGAGFALSDAAENSGLGPWIGEQLNGLEHLDKRLILIIVMLVTAAITEVASNTACANIIVPILLTLVSLVLGKKCDYF
jgi:sodium-dependent dicarboxylate transporter 2/3/5